MAFVSPLPWGGGGMARPARSRPAASAVLAAALTLLAATLITGGALGEDLRWLGGVAMSYLVVTRALRWSGALLRRPWVRLGLRLAAAAAVLAPLDIAMPDASAVGSVFLACAIVSLTWLGFLRLIGLDSFRSHQVVATMAVLAGVGLWFAAVGGGCRAGAPSWRY